MPVAANLQGRSQTLCLELQRGALYVCGECAHSHRKGTIAQNMWLEGGPKLPLGGWAEIKSFGQVASLAKNETAQLLLSGVWKSYRKSSRGINETAYLFVAEGNRVAQLSTFRP